MRRTIIITCFAALAAVFFAYSVSEWVIRTQIEPYERMALREFYNTQLLGNIERLRASNSQNEVQIVADVEKEFGVDLVFFGMNEPHIDRAAGAYDSHIEMEGALFRIAMPDRRILEIGPFHAFAWLALLQPMITIALLILFIYIAVAFAMRPLSSALLVLSERVGARNKTNTEGDALLILDSAIESSERKNAALQSERDESIKNQRDFLHGVAHELFTRLDPSRARQSGGTGLGLSVVHGIIMRIGGNVSINDSALGGAKVIVSWPLTGGMDERRD